MEKLKHFQKVEMFTISAQVFVIPDKVRLCGFVAWCCGVV